MIEAGQAVITGIGVISPIGNSAEELWESLEERRSGVRRPSSSSGRGVPAAAGRAANFSGSIDDFGSLEAARKKSLRKALKLMTRESQMAVAAADQALRDSGLAADAAGVQNRSPAFSKSRASESADAASVGDVGHAASRTLPASGTPEPERVGVVFGAGYVSMLPEDFVAGVEACRDARGEFDESLWGEAGLPQIAPLWLLKCLPNMPACHIAILGGFLGPNNTITQAEAAANLAVAEGAALIAEGSADAVVVGGTGDNLLPCSLMHSLVQEEMAECNGDPAALCRPFERRRCGMVVAEGAAALVLEKRSAAERRGATIYGVIAGAGSSCVVDRAGRPDRTAALQQAMLAALRSSGQRPGSIGHLHAHALSTRSCDVQESRAILRVFGEPNRRPPVLALKSYTGNAGAGSGAIELAASLLALQRRRSFPILNYEEPDPDCPIEAATSADVDLGDSFLNLNVTSQGQASCVLVRRAA